MIVNTIVTFAFIFCSLFVEDNGHMQFLLTISIQWGDDIELSRESSD